MIRRGEPWGHATTMPDDAIIIRSDHALAAADPGRAIFLAAGNIAHSLGNPAIPSTGDACTEVSIDAMICSIVVNGGEQQIIGASSIVIGSQWRGRQVIITNAGWLNGSNIAPRAHPNDGFVEMLTMSPRMTFRQRVLARRRMRTGTHLPHPEISMNRINSASVERIGGEKLCIDDREIPSWTSVSIHVEPDYWRVVV